MNATQRKSTTVVLVDDYKILRDGLRLMIESQSMFDVVGEADNGRAALDLVKRVHPDIVIMDIGMPDLNGIDATRAIRAAHPHIKVVALSMHSDQQFVAGMLKAGASGYLLKDSAFEELSTAIETVAAGRIYLSPSISSVVVDGLLNPMVEGQSPQLTPRGREVLQLLAEGHSTKQIAMRLHVSSKTVESHRRQLMEKLGVSSVAALTKIAIQQGLTTLEQR